MDELNEHRTHALVGLEQLVHSAHMDADGQVGGRVTAVA